MSDNYRQERIERLLKELEYEINRGIYDNEIDEEFYFRFYVPTSRSIPNGIVACEFRSRPVPHYMYSPLDNPEGAKLRVVK